MHLGHLSANGSKLQRGNTKSEMFIKAKHLIRIGGNKMTQDEYENESEEEAEEDFQEEEEQADENISLLWNYKPKHEAIDREMSDFVSSLL